MTAASTYGFSKSSADLFTPEEARQLMHIEFARAQRHDLPLCVLAIQIDRLEQVATLHGHESKHEIRRHIVELIKRETRGADLLGIPVEDRLAVLLPHMTAATVPFLCERLLAGARRLAFASQLGTVHVTLSIGVAHNQHSGSLSFETLERVAAEGVAVADAAGGDRWVETQLYQLYEGKRADTGGEVDYRERLEQMVAHDGDLEQAASALAEEIVTRALREARQEQEELGVVQAPALDSDKEREYQREIDRLKRRLAKLTRSLGLTETALHRRQALEAVDEGVASVFRQVQGLQGHEERAELKRELMTRIFEANLDLQKRHPA